MQNSNISVNKFFVGLNKVNYYNLLMMMFFVFMIFCCSALKAQNIDGISLVPSKDKIIPVKTKTVKSFNEDMISCGDGFFWGVEEADSVKNADTYLYGKFTAKNNELQVIKAKIDLPRDRMKALDDWSIACDSVNVGGKSLLILRFSNDEEGAWEGAWIVHEKNIYRVSGSVHTINHGRVIVYCNNNSCIDSVNRINTAIGTNIESRKTHRDVKFVDFSFGDDVILYKIFDNKDYNPFENNSHEDSINARDGYYCSLASKYDKINEAINLVNICSLLAQVYANGSMKYYENRNYYFFPFLGEGRVEYYECKGLNSCAGHIFPNDAHLQHESYWTSEGKITTFGGFTTRYSDGYGPDYYFCVSRKNKNRSCVQRIYPNVASEEGENDNDSEELRLFFADGKYYFYVSREKDGVRTYNIEEIISPF